MAIDKKAENTRPKNTKIRMVADYLPLIVFFACFKFYDIFIATGSLIITSTLAVGAIYATERRIPIMPMVTAILITIFGGITLFLQDENFIKIKSTIIQLLFAAILFGSILLKKNALQILFRDYMKLTPRGWHIMTRNYAILFVCSALLNEIVRRTQTTDVWVSFKVFGFSVILILFSIVQGIIIQKYAITNKDAD